MLLEPGRDGPPRLRFINPNTDFAGYERIIVDPVVVWEDDTLYAAGIATAELRGLAEYFEASLREELAHAFDVVDRPEPGTLRLKAALTGVTGSGTSVELDLRDAMTDERLAAVVGSRDSEGIASGPQEPWSEARESLRIWALRTRDRFAAIRDFDAMEALHEQGLPE
jgi:hypothetical protein